MFRVALLDDHSAVLVGLRRLIDAERDLAVIAAAPTAPKLAKQLAGIRPDVLVLDYDLARGDGLAHCRRIKDRRSAPAVVMYTSYATPAVTLAARVAQADGLVDKAGPVAELLATIRRVARGGGSLPPVPPYAYEAAVGRLRDEDLPIFAMLLDGESPESIAQVLGTHRAEISWRAQRIIGRLQPRFTATAQGLDARESPASRPPARHRYG